MTNLAKRSALGLRFSRVGTCGGRDRSGLRARQRVLGVGRAPGGAALSPRTIRSRRPAAITSGRPTRATATASDGEAADDSAARPTPTPPANAAERRGRGRGDERRGRRRRVGRVRAARPRLPGGRRHRRPAQGGPAPRLPQEAPLRALRAGRLLRLRRAVVDLQLRRRAGVLSVGGLRRRAAGHPDADAVPPRGGVHGVRPADALLRRASPGRGSSRCSGPPSTPSSSSATRPSSTANRSPSPARGAPPTPPCWG